MKRQAVSGKRNMEERHSKEEDHSREEGHSREEKHSREKLIKEKSNKEKLNREKQNKTVKYGACILTFTLLISSALWLPQVFFEVSDALMYGEVSLMEQEKLDVLTLTTGYEASLYRRLAGFAQGLAGQRQYYVDKQPKEVTDEIRAFLYESELRFSRYGIYEDIIMGLFSESLGLSPAALATLAKRTTLDLYQWNQYVIYSDDYAQGVNFILWCFSLENSDGDNLDILMDAHDYTVYAVQMTIGTEHSYSMLNQNEMMYIYNDISMARFSSMERSSSMEGSPSMYTHGSIWAALNIYYDIFDAEELQRNFTEIIQIHDMWDINLQPARIAGVLRDSAGNDVNIYLDAGSEVPYGADGEGWYGEGVDGIPYYNLPFQETKMTFDIYNFGELEDEQQTVNSSMGIREIYELIPEFQHFG